MVIDPKIKAKLDEKYALGEINEDEYDKRIKFLESRSDISGESKDSVDSLSNANTVGQADAMFNQNSDGYLSIANTVLNKNISSTNNSALNAHHTFSDRYEVILHLGTGGMGTVLLCKDRKLNREVALKRIKKDDRIESENAQRRFKAEAQTIASLNHQNIIHIHDIGEDDDGLFIVMEYIDGSDLTKKSKNQGN